MHIIISVINEKYSGLNRQMDFLGLESIDVIYQQNANFAILREKHSLKQSDFMM